MSDLQQGNGAATDGQHGDLGLLFAPLRVGGVTLSNRVFVPAHEPGFGEHRLMSDRYIAYVVERARGGAALVMPGGASVHPDGERVGHLPIWGPECLPGYRKLAAGVHAHGAKVFVQLFHCGAHDEGTARLEHRHPVRGPATVASPLFRNVPRPMDAADIADTVHHFGVSAANMREAEIDGVEIGAGDGYLICQFLSPLTNTRVDEYGGSTENRCRLLREVASEVRRRVGAEYPVGLRMSFDEFVGDAGITPALAEEMLAHIHSWNLLDFVDVSASNDHSRHRLVVHMSADVGGHLAPYAQRAKRVVNDEIPVFVSSGVRTIGQAAEILREGQADLVGMARAHIADPEVVSKARTGRVGEIRRCVGANQGCIRQASRGSRMYCTVNPAAGREAALARLLETPAPEPRTVLVVGSGPGGLQAAKVAAERGHEVALWEGAGELGGMLRFAARLPARHRWQDLIDDLAAAVKRHGARIELGHRGTVADIEAHGADVVILATGATYDTSGFSLGTPSREAPPGWDTARLLDPVEALADVDAVGQSVLILDDTGGHTPVSVAILLAETGRRVEIVTHELYVGPHMGPTLDFPWTYARAVKAGVHITDQAYVSGIEGDVARVASIWGNTEERVVPAETVIVSMLRKSEVSLYHALVEQGHAAQRIGDCVAPREVDDAIEEATRVALAVGASVSASA